MGGAQYQIKCLLEYLRRLDRYDIHYLARRVPNDHELDGYSIHRIGHGQTMSKIGFVADAPDLYQALRILQPDVIYQRVGCAYTGIAAHFARRNGCALVWHAANDTDVQPGLKVADRNFVRQRLERTLLSYGIRRADRTITQTEYQARLLLKNFGRGPDAVIANFHPLPEERRTPDEPLRIVWIANFKRAKQPEAFLRLADSLRGLERVQFVMIGASAGGEGEAQWNDALLQKIATLPNLTHLGQLNQTEVNRQLAGAYAFVNTSVYEGFPNTFIQAWLREVPVISLTVNPDDILDREAVGIHARTEQGLSDAVRRLVEDRALHDQLARNAGEHAREHHSMKNAQRLVQVIDSALASRNVRP
jgi:glycosyltransferase involved in cell wall biosynthesis